MVNKICCWVIYSGNSEDSIHQVSKIWLTYPRSCIRASGPIPPGPLSFNPSNEFDAPAFGLLMSSLTFAHSSASFAELLSCIQYISTFPPVFQRSMYTRSLARLVFTFLNSTSSGNNINPVSTEDDDRSDHWKLITLSFVLYNEMSPFWRSGDTKYLFPCWAIIHFPALNCRRGWSIQQVSTAHSYSHWSDLLGGVNQSLLECVVEIVIASGLTKTRL